MVEATRSLQVMRCAVAGQSYCIDASSVANVVQARRMQRSETAKTSVLAGRLTFGDSVYPVYSLAQRFGCTSSCSGKDEQILILQSTQGKWGLLVDQVSPAEDLSRCQLLTLPRLVRYNPRNFFEAIVVFRADSEDDTDRQSTSYTGESEMVLMLAPQRLHPETGDIPVLAQRSGLPPSGQVEDLSTSAPQSTPDPSDGESNRASMVVFSINGGQLAARFALSVSQVVEICRPSRWIPIPASPPEVLGLLNWRTLPATVIDLGVKLGIPPEQANPLPRLLVARGFSEHHELVAFPIAAGSHVTCVPAKSRRAHVPEQLRQELLCGSFDMDGENLLIPNLSGILAGR
jgi:chemotaxis signal transduction protein